MKTLIILMLISTNLMARSQSWPAWQWSHFKLNNFFELERQNPTQAEIESYLNVCIQTVSEDDCNDASVMLILLSRLDSIATINHANNLLSAIPDDEDNELHYLRLYAIKALARSGQVNQLLEHMGDSPTLEEMYIFAQIQDNRWETLFKSYIGSDNSSRLCSGIFYIKPYIQDSYTNYSEYINMLISNTLNSDLDISGCAVVAIQSHELAIDVEKAILNNIETMINSGNSVRIKHAEFLSERWPVLTDNLNLFSNLVQLAVVPDDIDTNFYSSLMLHAQNLISEPFPRLNPQDIEPENSIIYAGRSSLADHLIVEAYNQQWEDYASQLSFIELKKIHKIHRTCTHKEKPPSQKSIILAWF